jgi:arylsulfatase A-like enzyme
VPMLVRWPGKIKPGQISNEIVQHHDWFPTFLAMAGDPAVVEKLKSGYQAIGRTYRNHIDGYNFLPYLTGGEANGPRKEFFYFTDDGDLSALRYGNWKILFMVQRGHGLEVWQEQYDALRFPILENLRSDPFERADESIDYGKWRVDHLFMLVPAQAIVAQYLQSFKEFPPRARPGSFTIGKALDSLYRNSNGSD